MLPNDINMILLFSLVLLTLIMLEMFRTGNQSRASVLNSLVDLFYTKQLISQHLR